MGSDPSAWGCERDEWSSESEEPGPWWQTQPGAGTVTYQPGPSWSLGSSSLQWGDATKEQGETCLWSPQWGWQSPQAGPGEVTTTPQTHCHTYSLSHCDSGHIAISGSDMSHGALLHKEDGAGTKQLGQT